MLIKNNKTWKDLAEAHKGPKSLSRRELIGRGLATGTLSVVMSNLVSRAFMNQTAFAAVGACPVPVLNPGAIAQIFAEGGPTMSARFISENQASVMNATMAMNYGISGQANLMRLGPNLVIDKTSPFGFTLLQGPPGYPGGTSAWQTNVLTKISGGGHLGPFNADDGAGRDSGLLGGVSPFKQSQTGKDIKINVNSNVATWADGLPATAVRSATPTNLAAAYSLTPAANGLTNAQALSNAADASRSIAEAMSPVLGNTQRKAAAQTVTSATCSFYGNTLLADPNYGDSLFNPNSISALTDKMTVANLSPTEQGQLAAFYQSARGVTGGTIMQLGGRDYHGQDPQTQIAPADIEEARAIVMFLAACEVAGSKGAMMYFSNGHAIAKGTAQVTATINGVAATLNAPSAQNDAGGSYNAGLIIFYNPTGAPPQSRFTGSIESSTGNVKTDPNIGSSREAVAGLYLSALSWVNAGTISQVAITKMQSTGVASSPTRITVI